MAVSKSFAGDLTRAHLASLPDRANPVHLHAVLLLRKKGYSKREAARMAEEWGSPLQRPEDYYERTMERYAAEMKQFHETGILETYSAGRDMKQKVRAVPTRPWWARMLQNLMWGQDLFENLSNYGGNSR
jgi:hypothetical protein